MASEDVVRGRLEAAAEVIEERRDYTLLPDARAYLEQLFREAAKRMTEEGRTSEADITLAIDRLTALLDEAAGNQMAGPRFDPSPMPPSPEYEPPPMLGI
jgi:hypothetical protein